MPSPSTQNARDKIWLRWFFIKSASHRVSKYLLAWCFNKPSKSFVHGLNPYFNFTGDCVVANKRVKWLHRIMFSPALSDHWPLRFILCAFSCCARRTAIKGTCTCVCAMGISCVTRLCVAESFHHLRCKFYPGPKKIQTNVKTVLSGVETVEPFAVIQWDE